MLDTCLDAACQTENIKERLTQLNQEDKNESLR